ncbi:MAG: hypothetical protein HY978_03080 [Candidatus Liptonbacteria bacterium]|nr:hypothetical protein [Candidatus Liptonbacteria bacterium]
MRDEKADSREKMNKKYKTTVVDKKSGSVLLAPSPRRSLRRSAGRSSLLASPGQTIVETLVAVSVLTVGFLGILGLLNQSLGLNRVVADSYVGSYLAAEGVEIIKNLTDTNVINGQPWNSGIGPNCPPAPGYQLDYASTAGNLQNYNPSQSLYYDPAAHRYNIQAMGNPTTFRRKVEICWIGPQSNEMRVNSTVTWTTRGGAQYSVNVEDHFYKWR